MPRSRAEMSARASSCSPDAGRAPGRPESRLRKVAKTRHRLPSMLVLANHDPRCIMARSERLLERHCKRPCHIWNATRRSKRVCFAASSYRCSSSPMPGCNQQRCCLGEVAIQQLVQFVATVKPDRGSGDEPERADPCQHQRDRLSFQANAWPPTRVPVAALRPLRQPTL